MSGQEYRKPTSRAPTGFGGSGEHTDWAPDDQAGRKQGSFHTEGPSYEYLRALNAYLTERKHLSQGSTSSEAALDWYAAVAKGNDIIEHGYPEASSDASEQKSEPDPAVEYTDDIPDETIALAEYVVSSSPDSTASGSVQEAAAEQCADTEAPATVADAFDAYVARMEAQNAMEDDTSLHATEEQLSANEEHNLDLTARAAAAVGLTTASLGITARGVSSGTWMDITKPSGVAKAEGLAGQAVQGVSQASNNVRTQGAAAFDKMTEQGRQYAEAAAAGAVATGAQIKKQVFGEITDDFEDVNDEVATLNKLFTANTAELGSEMQQLAATGGSAVSAGYAGISELKEAAQSLYDEAKDAAKDAPDKIAEAEKKAARLAEDHKLAIAGAGAIVGGAAGLAYLKKRAQGRLSPSKKGSSNADRVKILGTRPNIATLSASGSFKQKIRSAASSRERGVLRPSQTRPTSGLLKDVVREKATAISTADSKKLQSTLMAQTYAFATAGLPDETLRIDDVRPLPVQETNYSFAAVGLRNKRTMKANDKKWKQMKQVCASTIQIPLINI